MQLLDEQQQYFARSINQNFARCWRADRRGGDPNPALVRIRSRDFRVSRGSPGGYGLTLAALHGGSGIGGASSMGGGAGVIANGSGANAESLGAGGSGAAAAPSTTGKSGGAGGPGMVIVRKYA